MHRDGRRDWLCAALVIGLLLISAACGSDSSSDGSSNNGDVTIVITPTSATIPISTSQQFTATVSNASDTSVTWQVNGTQGGSVTYGTISSTGIYTAPGTVPSGTITVTAVSTANTSKTASATVTVTNANKLTLSPAQASVPAGGQQTFAVTLGAEKVDAAWSISCQSTVSGACGTISGTGIYTAPLSPPPGQLVSITASSKNNTANPAFAPVTVTFGSGTLLGQYSFAMAGVTAGGQPFTQAGSITFDGKGGIADGGIEDQGGPVPITITGGTYETGGQGRVSATVHTSLGDEKWQITIVNHSRALVMRSDSVVARGDLDLQNSAQFGRSLSGNFVFQLRKRTSAAIPFSAIVGSLAFDSAGNITAGALDSNDGGAASTDTAVSGTSTASDASTGRGEITLSSSLGTQMFAYYPVNSTSAKLIQIDGTSGFAGLAARSSGTVTVDQFAGPYAFVFRGANSSGEVAQGGTFVANSSGVLSNTSFDTSTDAASRTGDLFSGSFVVKDATTGRTEATFNIIGGTTLKYVLYPPSLAHEIPFLEIDGQNVTAGLAVRQSNIVGGTSPPSLSGQFAMVAGETSGTVKRTVTGTIKPSSVATGTLDVNDAGTVTLGTPLQSSSFSGSSFNGRATLQLQAGSSSTKYTAYIVDSGTVLLLETDGTGALSGAMQKQY